MSYGPRHMPPRCEVHWAGFMSDTYTLQRFGWDAAIEHAENQHLNMGSLRLLLRHRQAGWAMYAECMDDYGRMRAMAHLEYGNYAERPPRFEVRHCRPDTQMTLVQSTLRNPRGPAHDWGQIDMLPQHGFESIPVARMNVFAPWQREELIVAEDQVNDLMDRIRKLQEPELKEIRERNRTRDYLERSRETHHATILSIAA